MTRAPGRRALASGLFRRIFVTFLLTVLAFVAAVAVAAFTLASAYGPEWVERTLQAVEDQGDQFLAELHDPPQLERTVARLADEVDARVAIYQHRGELIAGKGPEHVPHPVRRHRRRLRRGRPVVWRPNALSTPLIYWGLVDPNDGELAAIVRIDTGVGGAHRRSMVTGGLLLLVALAAGAYLLARSLTGRLWLLEASTGRIAGGDVAHRVDVGPGPPRDEIDQLGLAFNEMAGKIEALLSGQRKLLANVSHELRTPIARIKVLLEILEERIDRMGTSPTTGASTDVERVRKGLGEMSQDIEEVEALIGDLLTSGRLELGHGGESVIERGPVEVSQLLERVASRFDARVACDRSISVEGDELLLQRLLSNLLSNARRACPDGEVVVQCSLDGSNVEIAVQDEGPGIPAHDREAVFEPFSRLDAARARDHGGVGLGLHLCRQIAQAHGGTVRAEDRPDGRSGARLVISLPATQPDAQPTVE